MVGTRVSYHPGSTSCDRQLFSFRSEQGAWARAFTGAELDHRPGAAVRTGNRVPERVSRVHGRADHDGDGPRPLHCDGYWVERTGKRQSCSKSPAPTRALRACHTPVVLYWPPNRRLSLEPKPLISYVQPKRRSMRSLFLVKPSPGETFRVASFPTRHNRPGAR